MRKKNFLLFLVTGMLMQYNCSNKSKSDTAPVPPPNPAEPAKATIWLTKSDGAALLQKQSDISFSSPATNAPFIEPDSTQRFQSVDGFGYTLTGGSAYLINRMAPAEKAALLQDLFGNGENSIGVSYLRISIGASDLNAAVFSYNDMPAGQTDPALANFSLAQDTVDLIPVLKQILAINPSVKIMGSPWSAPAWMKDNKDSKGGSLLPQYYASYAQYFVKYLQQMKSRGISVDAVTVQNEPLHGGNNPSMVMTAAQQASFIKNNLGPAFASANLSTKIIVYDHNADRPDYPIEVLNDAAAKTFVDGSAFHLYAGDIVALSGVRAAHPDKNIYFTEQWTGANGSFDGDLKWHTKNVVIGSLRNWSRTALEWNLANDPTFGPHTPGGCTECKGAVTIDGNSVTKNVGYYIIAHASKFVPPGSVRIASSVTVLPNVAFLTPAGKKVMIVLNEGASPAAFNIKWADKWAPVSLPAGTVATVVW